MAANDALLLIGHGSARYPDAGSAIHLHAESLRHAKRFAQVEVGLLNGAPSVAEALARIGAATIRVVPFFMEDGYFTRVAVPRALGVREVPHVRGAAIASDSDAPQAFDIVMAGEGPPSTPGGADPGKDVDGGPSPAMTGRWAGASAGASIGSPRILFCPPVGVHDGMAGLIERQALAACIHLGVPPHSAAVLVVGHGSSGAPGRALALHRHVSQVAGAGLFARVEAACLEEAPFAGDALPRLRAHPVVVIGFFAGDGLHVRDDVPALIAAELAARVKAGLGEAGLGEAGLAVRFHGSVADDPAMTEIILEHATSLPRGE